MINSDLVWPGDILNNDQKLPMEGSYKRCDWTDYDSYQTPYIKYVI